MNESYKEWLESIAHPLILLDAKGNIISANYEAKKSFGFLKGRTFLRLIREKELSPEKQIEKEVNFNGYDIDIRLRPVFSEDGCIYFIASLTDITAAKRTEQDLKNISEVYQTVVENSLAAISIHQDGITRFVNRRYAEMLGFEDPAQCIGRPFWASIHPDDVPMVKERGLMREKHQVLPAQYVFREVKQDGTVIWVEIRATHATYMGKPAAVTNLIDITQRVKAEEEIRTLSQRLVRVREDERKKLAADLHDQMGQTLTAMHFDLENLRTYIPDLPPEGTRLYERLVANVEALADHLRKTTLYMRSDLLEQKMLIAVLDQLVKEFMHQHPQMKVSFQSLGFKKRLNPEIELTVYRIFQESLRNISKHARADHVEIILTYSHPRIILTIRDNGVGFSPKKKAKTRGIGLISMKERVVSFGGEMDVISAPGKGTTLRFDIPVC
ncbi:MAG: PAS domain-containing sensor histidine kinase [Syntrophales bacterium]|nr:PAS domain-containing sensor histidine kinase [Syntrophales bacterium]